MTQFVTHTHPVSQSVSAAAPEPRLLAARIYSIDSDQCKQTHLPCFAIIPTLIKWFGRPVKLAIWWSPSTHQSIANFWICSPIRTPSSIQHEYWHLSSGDTHAYKLVSRAPLCPWSPRPNERVCFEEGKHFKHFHMISRYVPQVRGILFTIFITALYFDKRSDLVFSVGFSEFEAWPFPVVRRCFAFCVITPSY